MQLRKEGRRNEYERHKLQALTQRQKLVSSSSKIALKELEYCNIFGKTSEEKNNSI
jgi:hypothetical protein